MIDPRIVPWAVPTDFLATGMHLSEIYKKTNNADLQSVIRILATYQRLQAGQPIPESLRGIVFYPDNTQLEKVLTMEQQDLQDSHR